MIKTEKNSNDKKTAKSKQLKNGKIVLKAKEPEAKAVVKVEASNTENKYKKLIAKKRTFSETDNKNEISKDSAGYLFFLVLRDFIKADFLNFENV